MNTDIKTGIALLKQGKAPGNDEILREITVGYDSIVNFIGEKYFSEYIALGGSKIKFVTGKEGSGKTHFLQLIELSARERGFVSAHFSANDVWLHDFKDVYAQIFKSSDIMLCLTKCASVIVSELGFDYSDIPANMNFVDYLSSIGELDALIKKEIRNQIRVMFMKNPLIDNNFAIACSLLTGGILGHPILEASNRELLTSWMSCEPVKLPSLRALGMSPAKITKYNARHMLRSLAQVYKTASVPGIAVIIDNADVLVRQTPPGAVRYTKLKREDAFESIRELIDEIDTLQHVMFFYAFDRQLIDDEQNGIKSYQALWMRIQNEIVSSDFNYFTDIIDLDRFASLAFSEDTLASMSEKAAAVINRHTPQMSAKKIGAETAGELLSNAKYSEISLPRQVMLATAAEGYITEGDAEYDRF